MRKGIITSTKQTTKMLFTPEDDSKIRLFADNNESPNWEKFAETFPNRSARQLRERYNNYLRPGLSSTPFSEEEDDLIIHLVEQYGTSWKLISSRMPNRSANQIKLHWFRYLKDPMKRINYRLKHGSHVKSEEPTLVSDALDEDQSLINRCLKSESNNVSRLTGSLQGPFGEVEMSELDFSYVPIFFS